MKRLILLISILLILSSCSPLPITGGEDLLQAPILNQMQKEVYDALKLTLDTSSIVYAHPKSGEHRSPFVFFDLDGDGQDEAIVFYAYKNEQTQVFAKILRWENERWQPFHDITGNGPTVEFVEFSPLLNTGSSCILIGWGESSKHAEKTMSVYSLEDNLVMELEQPYTAYHIVDYENSDLKELVLIQKKGETFEASLYYERYSKLSKMQSIPLYEETTDILQILPGKLNDGSYAIYIDEEMAGVSVSYGTEIIVINSSMDVVVGSEYGKRPEQSTVRWESYTQTFRTRELLSVDSDEDGRIEIPRIKESAYVDSPDNPRSNGIDLIEYMQYTGERFFVNHTAAINPEAGYLIYFPDRWIDKVIVEKEPQRQEWRFKKIDIKTGEPSTELFRVRVFYAQDYIDEFTKDDIFLGNKGLFSYYGYIPQTLNEPLAITQQEAEELFAII